MSGGALLDANLLCLLTVGRADVSAISSHPRLRAFEHIDFFNVVAVLDRVGDLLLCPHVLTEASNLLCFRQTLAQQARWLTSLADIVAMAQEHGRPARQIIKHGSYARLGLTDAMLLLLAEERKSVLVSDDLQLCLDAERRGARTINYNYIRDGALRIDQL